MSLSRFFGIRVISAAIAVVFFFTQGGFAQNPIEHKPVSSQLSVDILQDVHCNSQTQDSIYKYLENLYVQNKLTGIFQEGASGNIDRSIWSKLEPSKRNKVIAGLYRDGWMGGAEKFAVEHPEISYVGVELKALYDIHREVYRDVTAKQESARKSLRELNENLTQLKSKFYSSKLIRLEKEWQMARRDGNTLYLFIKNNLKNIPENKLSELEPGFRALIEAIKNEKKPSDLSIDDFGSGIEKFHELLRAPLVQSDEAAKLVKIVAYYELLKELWDLELTPQSYEKYLSLEKNTSLKADLAYLLALLNKESDLIIFAQDNRNAAKAYYELAKRRDSAIYKNVTRSLKNKSGHFVLVAGGFHGQDLASRFKQVHLSYSLIKPQFSEIDSNLQDKYARAMGQFPSRGDLKIVVQSLMALIPEPVSVRPEFVQALEPVPAFSLGKTEAGLKSSASKTIVFTSVLVSLILGLPSQVLAQGGSATTAIPNHLGTMILLSAAITISAFTLVVVITRLLLSVKSVAISEDWVSKPISKDEPIHFTVKDSLTIDTETSKLKTLQFFQGKFGLADREAKEDLSEGINYFIQSDSPKVEQVENLLIPALKIRQNSGGELQIGKFLPFGTEQSFSVRFQIGEDSAASAATLTLDDDPYLSNPVIFSQEQSFARWNDREINAAYVDLGDKLVLIIPKFGPMKLAEIKKGQFDAVDLKDNLEAIKVLSSELETAPVIITSEKITFHSLTKGITDYKHPFIIKRESGMLTLRFMESVKDWNVKILEKKTLGPVPIRHKESLAAAGIAAMLLLSPVTYYLFFAPRALEIAVPAPQMIAPPAPPAPVIPPAPVASRTTPVVPPAPVAPPVAPVVPPAPIASRTIPVVPPEPITSPVAPVAPNRFGLPGHFQATVEQARHYITSPVDGIAAVISDGAKVVVAPAGLATRYLQKKARFDALATQTPIENSLYKNECEASLKSSGVRMPVKSDPIQGMRDELVGLNRELVNLERDLSRGAVDVNGGRLLVRNGDSVQAGGRIVELPVQNGRNQLEFTLPQSQGVAVLLGFVKLEVNHVPLNNLTTYMVSNQGDEQCFIVEFDAVDGLTVGNNVDVQISLNEEGKKAGDARPEILDVKAPHSGWYQILRGGLVSRTAGVVQSLGDRKDAEISEVERLIVINGIERIINADVIERYAAPVEAARTSVAGIEQRISRLQGQLDANPRAAENQDKSLAEAILRNLSGVLGDVQSAPDAASSLSGLSEISSQLRALTYSGSRFKTLSDNVSRALTALIDQLGKTDRDKSGDAALISDLINKVTEARRFDPASVPVLTEAQIAEYRDLIKRAKESKIPADNLILDYDAAVRFNTENSQALQVLQARLEALRAVVPSVETISSPSDGSVILFAGQNGIFWVQENANLFRVAHANSLGMTRREALIRAAKLTALVGVGLTTGCLSQDVINRVMTDPAEGVPDSMITPAADVKLKEVLLTIDSITPILKNPTGVPVAIKLKDYIPERSYGIKDALSQREAAKGAQDFLAGFAITPQFSVSTDFNGGFGVQGGFTIQVPVALGGGTIYIPIGVNSLEEDLKATLSFVSMTQNLIVGAGNYFSDMSQIALRTKEYTYDQQVNETLLKVQTIYREIWYLRKAMESSDKQIALLQDELTYANGQIIPNAGSNNIGPQRYKTQVAGFLAQRQAEKDGFQSDINAKLETLRRIFNLNPSVQFNFNFEGMDTDQVEDFTISGLTDVDEMLRIIALTDRRVGEAYGQYEALGHLLWLDSRRVNIPEAVISVFGGHNVADTFLFNPQDQNGINFLKPTNRYGGALLRGPELLGLWNRIRNGNSDATDRLKAQRLVLDNAKKAVLEEIRDSKSDLDGKRDALKAAFQSLQTLRQELVDVRAKRVAFELDMKDDFAKQREINDAERDLLKKRAEYLTAVRSFQARYLPYTKEYLTTNVTNSGSREAQITHLGRQLVQHTKELTDSAIVWGTRTVSLQEFATGSSLGTSNKAAGLHFDKQKISSSILASKFGFVAALFGLVIGAGSRKRAWKEFQSRFDGKIKNLTATSAPRAGQNSVVPIFAEERELSNNPEFINQFLKRSVDLEVFVNAANQEEAILKMAKYFPEGTLPKNLQVHFYNKQKPIYSVMDSRIAVVAAAGTRPVVITSEAGLFKKLEQAKSVIKVSHEKNYPGELVMEIGRRIGLANGSYDQISGDEKSLIAYDSSRGVFYLRPIEKLINDLFQQVIRDYQIKIAA